jgi:hypothetical protein
MFVLTLCPCCTSVIVLPAGPSGAAPCRACGAVVSARGATERVVGSAAEARALQPPPPRRAPAAIRAA